MTEPRHDKTNKVTVHPAKTQISLGIRPVCSDLHADSEVSDQTGRMPRLICVFAGRTLFVLSCRGSCTKRTQLSVSANVELSHDCR